ncbi:pilus assembly protein [Verminephrobacter aporrectodeae]|uniref:pilus assembly protein n=1 Tax=Verminephrobacter aporrectodeae TaxID=1110389 RepID=UPI002244D39F|nr:PilC/PilY family type IV pilus protein [Verminephrobacter aporrectodeae]
MKISDYMKSSLLLAALLSTVNLSAAPVDVSAPRNIIPPNIVSTANIPMLMLTASKDHLLFGPIYTDFEDLDDDGIIDTTFKPTFEYYGYFDSIKCYSYDKAAGQFNPSAMATQTTTTVGTVTSTKYSCEPKKSYWSGNFLNWVTMTRLDIVRKMLYGGYRDVDTIGSTVLVGTSLVWDAHSFVKYYRGDDIGDYTPFKVDDLKKAGGQNAGKYAGLSICITGVSDEAPNAAAQRLPPVMRLVKGNVRFWSTVEWEECRWRENYQYAGASFGPKLARFYFSGQTGNGEVRHETEIPSQAVDGAVYSGIGPELKVRVKVCDPALLGEERCQAFPSNSTSNFKPFGLLQEFGYPRALGEAARAEFGLITGSYDNYHENYLSNNRRVVGAAGALRKNMGDMEDEINRETGIFCHNPNSKCATTLPDGRATGVGAIKAFDSMLLYSRAYHNFTSDAAWLNPVGEILAQALQYYAHTGPSTSPSRTTNPNDSSVGMPLPAWNDPFVDSKVRREKYGNAVCRPLNILAISSSTISYDENANTPFATLPNSAAGLDSFVNKIGDAEGITGTSRSVGSVPGNDDRSCSAKQVNKLSDVRGICPEAPAMKGSYHVAGVALYGNTKPVRILTTPPADLAEVENALKVRTMAASLSGGAPRIDVPVPADLPVPIPLAPLAPAIPKKYVSITPESVQEGGEPNSPLTFVSISSGPLYGAFIVTWNDTFLAADYDMDITGFIRYDLIRNQSSPSGWDIRVRTDIPNVCGGLSGTHGFSIVGVQKRDGSHTSANGRYLTHQHGRGNWGWGSGILPNMPPISQYLCGDSTYRAKTLVDSTGATVSYADTVCFVTQQYNYCAVKDMDYLHDETFHMVGEANALIKEPLWYAGKYGSFKSSVKNADGTYSTVDMPSTQLDWDSIKADGNDGSDGIPDGYFLARRPELLEAQLHKALNVVAKTSSAAPAVASAQLTGNDYKYVVKFDSTTVSGTLEAYKVDSEGEFSTAFAWEVGKLLDTRVSLDSGENRSIITNSGNGSTAGVKFRWASLPAAYKTQMTTASTNNMSEANAEVVLDYMRGNRKKEDISGLRQRASGFLGPIVNGAPWVQGSPGSTLAGIWSDGYTKFFGDHKTRIKLLWVAANDGMLHAFNADTGAEVFAYVPGALANRLAEIPLQRGTGARTKLGGNNFVTGNEKKPAGTVWPYVDGSPFSADVKVGTDWKTYVFGTLGRGGKGIFALDATEVVNLTEANASTVFKWQFTSDDDEDLGYITGDVSIHPASSQALPVAKMNNGNYALLLGNGNKSKTGKAVLFVLYMDGPTGDKWTGRYEKIVVDAGSNNGLSAPRWEDVDGNGTADVAYAGDMKGNIWKFNLADSSPAKWGSAFKMGSTAQPLYTATYVDTAGQVTPLPISTAPQLLFMGKGGLMVNFATGNAFETGDFPRTGVVQRVYGIWDRPGLGIPPGRDRPIGIKTLAARKYTRNADGVVTITSDTTLNWSTHDGWYMDLPGSAEAVLSDPSLDAGVMTFVTVRPKGAASSDCSSTPESSFYTVDPISGRAERNIQGSITVSNLKVLVAAKDISDQKVRVVADRTKKPFKTTTKACTAGDPGCTCVSTGCTKEDAPICGPDQRAKRVTGRSVDAVLCTSTAPRLQWREIPGLRTDQ